MANPNPPKSGQFKPGVAPNPNGSSALARELGNAKKLNQVQVSEILNRFVVMPLEEVISFAGNKKNPAMEVLVASILMHGIKNGDQSRLTFLLDRLIGKVKEVHEHTFLGNVNTAIVDKIAEIENSNLRKGGETYGKRLQSDETECSQKNGSQASSESETGSIEESCEESSSEESDSRKKGIE